MAKTKNEIEKTEGAIVNAIAEALDAANDSRLKGAVKYLAEEGFGKYQLEVLFNLLFPTNDVIKYAVAALAVRYIREEKTEEESPT